MALGDLYFDVLLRDKTGEGERAIRERLSKVGVDIGKDWANGLKSQLQNLTASIKPQLSAINLSNLTAQITLNVDKQKIVSDIQSALASQRFNLTLGNVNGLNISAGDAKAQAQLINAQARLINAQTRQAQSANSASLAQARLATEQQRTAREANRASIEDARLQRQRLALQQATDRATRANRQYNETFGGTQVSTLSRLTTLAQRYIGAFAGGAFISSLIKIRGEFELHLVALKSIVQSTAYATDLYQKMQSLSVQSPFQFKDLMSYAKQLAAYQIPANELYDTTKRLADVSAGLGVDMGRIILAYGQVRSASVLRGTELRQFTEAGVPMVQLLADKFSELESQVVSTSDVFDKISKREVPFQMVKDIFDEMTSAGGMFYQMQETQAETLYGKWSNLTDAYQIMMNKIGESSDVFLKSGIGGLTTLMENYESVITILTRVASAYGLVKVASMLRLSILGKETSQTLALALAEKKKQASDLMRESLTRKLNQQEQQIVATRNRLTMVDYQRMVANKALSQSELQRLYILNRITKAEFAQLASQMGMSSHLVRHVTSLGKAGKAWSLLAYGMRKAGVAFKAFTQMLKSNLLLAVLMTAFELVMDLVRVLGEGQSGELTKNIAESASESVKELDKFLKSYKVTLDKITEQSLSEAELKKAIKRIKEQIANTLGDEISEVTFGIDIEPSSQKAAEKAKKVLDDIREGIEKVGNAKFAITEDSFMWGLFGEGLISDIEDYSKNAQQYPELIQEVEKSVTSLNKAIADLSFEAQVAGIKQFVDQLLAMANVTPQARERVEDLIWRKSVVGFNPKAMDKAIEAWAKDSGVKQVIESGGVLSEEFAKAFNMKLANEGIDTSALINMTPAELTQRLRIYLAPEIANPTAVSELLDKVAKTYTSATLTTQGFRQPNTYELFSNANLGDWSKNNIKMFTPTGEDVSIQYQKLSKNDVERNRYIKSITEGETTTLAVVKKLQSVRAELAKDIDDAQQSGILVNERAKADAELATTRIGWIDEVLSANNIALTAPETSTVDEFTKRLKERYDLISDAIKEYMELADNIGSADALAKMKVMQGLKGVLSEEEFNKYFKVGGDKELISDYLKKVEGRTTDDAKSFIKSLNSAFRDLEIKGIADEVKTETEKINEALKLGAENYKTYQKILEKTGNKGLASFVAYGNTNAIAKDEVELLKAQLLQMSGGKGYEDIAKMSEEEFNKLPQNTREVFKKAEEAIRGESQRLGEEVATALEKGLSIEDKIKQVETRYQALIDFLSTNGRTTEAEGLIAVRDAEIAKLKAKLLELSPLWDKLFNKSTRNSTGSITKIQKIVSQIISNATAQGEGENKSFLSQYTLDDGQVQELNLTVEQMEKIRELQNSLKKELRDVNPFKALADAFKDINNAGGNVTEEMLVNLAESLAGVATIAADATQGLTRIFKACGDEDAAEAAEFVTSLFQGIASIAAGFAAGGVFGAAIAAGGVLMGLIANALEAHDKALEKQIKASKARVKELQTLRNELERIIERTLGGAYQADFSGNVQAEKYTKALQEYKALKEATQQGDLGAELMMRLKYSTKEMEAYEERLKGIAEYEKEIAKGNTAGANYKYILSGYKAEVAELENQIQKERDKKNTDKEKIADAQAEIAELNDKIKYFAEDTAKELYGIDFKDWASNLSDALVDAFAAGEDAAKAFDDTVADIMRNVLKEMIQIGVLEPMLNELRSFLFGEDGQSGAFGEDFSLDKGEVSQLGNILHKIQYEGIPNAQKLFDYINDATGGMLSETTEDGTLSGSIKGMQEETANLLASYLNAVRAYVASIVGQNDMMYVLSQAQLNQLTMIASNTARSASGVENLLSLLNSVTTVGSNGKMLKV